MSDFPFSKTLGISSIKVDNTGGGAPADFVFENVKKIQFMTGAGTELSINGGDFISANVGGSGVPYFITFGDRAENSFDITLRIAAGRSCDIIIQYS